MSLATSTTTSVDAPGGPLAASVRRSRVSLYMDLTKARLSGLVLISAAVGFVLAAPQGIDWALLLATMIGTGLAACSAAVLNQVIEVKRDAKMHRTRTRPLPSGALGINHSFALAVAMGYLGVGILALAVNLTAAWLALLTIVIYALVYTPLKARSTFNTLVGAVCGALPPVIGWVAVRGPAGLADSGAWVLAAILFIWQLPHFLSLAWMYREDYARGGFVMLPVVDPQGELTSRVIVLSSLILLPLALLATAISLAGWIFLAGAILLGVWMTALGVRFYIDRSDASARRVFLASIIYLSALFGLMFLDGGPVRTGQFTQVAAADVSSSEGR